MKSGVESKSANFASKSVGAGRAGSSISSDIARIVLYKPSCVSYCLQRASMMAFPAVPILSSHFSQGGCCHTKPNIAFNSRRRVEPASSSRDQHNFVLFSTTMAVSRPYTFSSSFLLISSSFHRLVVHLHFVLLRAVHGHGLSVGEPRSSDGCCNPH